MADQKGSSFSYGLLQECNSCDVLQPSYDRSYRKWLIIHSLAGYARAQSLRVE